MTTILALPDNSPATEICTAHSTHLQLVCCPHGQSPPPTANFWWTDPWTWGATPGNWIPAGMGAFELAAEAELVAAAPAPLGARSLLGKTLVATTANPTTTLITFAAHGRGHRLGPLDTATAQAQIAAGKAATMIAPRPEIPAEWWTLDPITWWEANACLPLVHGLLFKQPGANPEPLARLFGPTTPAHREAVRQLLLTATELGLVDHSRADLFQPARFGK